MTEKIPGPAVSEKADAETSPVLPPEMIEAGAAVLRDARIVVGVEESNGWRGDWWQTREAARDIYLAMFGVLVEAGFRLVPNAAHKKMKEAGAAAILDVVEIIDDEDECGVSITSDAVQAVWSAMLTADEED